MSNPEMYRPRTRFEVNRLAFETVVMGGRRTKASPSITLSVEFDHDDQNGAMTALASVYDEALAQLRATLSEPSTSSVKEPPDTSWVQLEDQKGKLR